MKIELEYCGLKVDIHCDSSTYEVNPQEFMELLPDIIKSLQFYETFDVRIYREQPKEQQ